MQHQHLIFKSKKDYKLSEERIGFAQYYELYCKCN